MLRRSFLKLVGGFAAFFSTAKIKLVAAKPIGWADQRPEWCPVGFLPLQGQLVTKDKYPDLFITSIVDGKKYVPIYYGKDEGKLPKQYPTIPSDLEIAGWQDYFTRTKPRDPDKVAVPVIATQHMKWPNGRPIRSGFTSHVDVSKKSFEACYGKIPETGAV